jgi:hypothetical protein
MQFVKTIKVRKPIKFPETRREANIGLLHRIWQTELPKYVTDSVRFGLIRIHPIIDKNTGELISFLKYENH